MDCIIVCRRKWQSLGSLDVLFSCFANTWYGSIEASVDVDFLHLLELTLSSFYLNLFLHLPLWPLICCHPGKTRGERFTWATRTAWLRGKFVRHDTPQTGCISQGFTWLALVICLLSVFLLMLVSSYFRGMKALLDHQGFQDLRWVNAYIPRVSTQRVGEKQVSITGVISVEFLACIDIHELSLKRKTISPFFFLLLFY